MAPRPQNFQTNDGFGPRVSPDTGFENLGPPAGMPVLTTDPVDALPIGEPRRKLIALRQRSQDARAIWLPISDEIRELRVERQRADIRLKQLQLRRGAGGPDLDDDDVQVIDVRKTIARIDADMTRLQSLEQHRGAVMRNTGQVLTHTEDWLRSGRPAGTRLTEAPAIAVADIMRKGERAADALERVRMRLRELDADSHRVNSAPYPSADVKKKMREEIENLAMRGVPHVGALVETFGAIGWPRDPLALPLVAIGDKGVPLVGNAVGDVPDVLAMFAWLHRPALLKALDGLVDSESDDAAALSVEAREVKLSELAADKLATERVECALVFAMQEQSEAVEHRVDANPCALLNVTLVTV
jgi:hypothetical protein